MLFGSTQIASARSRPTLFAVDVERTRELDVGHVVRTEVHVHQTGNTLVRACLRVVLDALHERRRAVADPDDANSYLGAH